MSYEKILAALNSLSPSITCMDVVITSVILTTTSSTMGET